MIARPSFSALLHSDIYLNMHGIKRRSLSMTRLQLATKKKFMHMFVYIHDYLEFACLFVLCFAKYGCLPFYVGGVGGGGNMIIYTL